MWGHELWREIKAALKTRVGSHMFFLAWWFMCVCVCVCVCVHMRGCVHVFLSIGIYAKFCGFFLFWFGFWFWVVVLFVYLFVSLF